MNRKATKPKRTITNHHAPAPRPALTNREATNPKRWGGLGEERRSLPPN
jgi:hypothetical protein